MYLTNSGRIVIIDDKLNEVLPLMVSLSKMGAPYYYFSGEEDDLPKAPMNGIRFVFLDIELDGFGGRDEKSMASSLVSKLSKIISKENGPFTVIFWTKHQEIIENVINYCKKAEIPPIHYVDLEKTTCAANSYHDLPIFINDKLKENGALLSLVQWENLVHKSCSDFVHDFSSLVQVDEEWSSKISGILYGMAQADLGQNTNDNDTNFKAALRLLNQSFDDILHKLTNNDLSCPDGFELQYRKLEEEIKAKINNWLFIDSNTHESIRTGDVMKCKTEDDCVKSVKKYFNVQQADGVLCHIDVVITSECDIAQKKTLKTKDNETIHRVLKGLILANDTKIKKTQAIECFGPFLYDNKIAQICLHLGTTMLASESDLEVPEFRIRRALSNEIQAKTSCYLNRVGNSIIK
ncbi:MAG: hypothetical protein PHC50_02850 [Candidatus Cloacimonetes bacterium]|nr:hypothetical protein [Candidatus Cloacimonadota bacterium]